MSKLIERIEKLAAIPGVSGCEERVAEAILAELDGVCECSVDNLGNVIAFKKGAKTPKRRVLLSAHMDEVGFIVNHIDTDGMLRFATVGGIDTKLMAGKRVYVGDKMLPGSIGIRAIHQQKPEERTKAPSCEELYIDIGASSAEQAQEYVKLGDRCVFAHNFSRFGDQLLRAKALDNRVACALLIELLGEELPCDVTCAFTVQEETGCVGAVAVGNTVRPDIALVVETTTAADIGGVSERDRVCKLGDGPAISFMDKGAIYDRELVSLAQRTAEQNGIPFQMKQAVSGGNESRSLQTAQGGAKTLAISVPCRYLHSPATVLSEADVKSTLDLLRALLVSVGEM